MTNEALNFKLRSERAARNSYYNDYQHSQGDPGVDRINYEMYLIHDYAYHMLCQITETTYISAVADWNAKHGIKRPENG